MHIADAHARQVELQRFPARPVVERRPDAGLGTGEEQTFPLDIAADGARVRAHRDAGVDAGPAGAVVGGLEQVRREVVLLIAVGREIRRAGIKRRGLDDRHAREFSKRLGRHVFPRGAMVGGDVHEPVVAAGPEHARLHRRFGKGEDRGIPLGAGHVATHGTAAASHGVGVGEREVTGHLVPRRALICRTPHVLRGGVQGGRIVQREVDRKGPLESLRRILDCDAVVVAEPYRYVAPGVGALVVARELAHVATAERDVRIFRIDGDVRILAAGHREPVALADKAVVGSAGDRHGAVVLLRPVQAIRLLLVGGHVIELRRGLIALRAPRTAAVHRDRRAAVVAVDKTVRIFRVDPHDVRIPMRYAHWRKRASAVDGAMHREIHDVHGVLVHRIRREAHVIERPHHELLIATGARPRGAGVVGTEHAAQGVLGFDVRVHALRIRRRHRHADLADQPLRQARIKREFGPAVATVGALPQAAASRAGVHPPRRALKLPHRRVHDARVRHVDRQVGGARAVVQKEHLLPRRAAVGGPKHTAIGRRAERMTE